MNPLRICSVESSGRPRDRTAAVHQRFAFSHATVQGHQICGEERFSIEWRKDDDSVWYEIETISKPATLIAKLAQPVLQFYQGRFVAESLEAMREQVHHLTVGGKEGTEIEIKERKRKEKTIKDRYIPEVV